MFCLVNYMWLKKKKNLTVTHCLTSHSWAAEGLSAVAPALSLALCAPASVNAGNGGDGLWSVSATSCAWISAYGNWTVISSASGTWRKEKEMFPFTPSALNKLDSEDQRMIKIKSNRSRPISDAYLEPECDCRLCVPSPMVEWSISTDMSWYDTEQNLLMMPCISFFHI